MSIAQDWPLLALASPEAARPSVGIAPAPREVVHKALWKRLASFLSPSYVRSSQARWSAHRVQRMYETRAAHLLINRDDLSTHGNPTLT